MKNSLSMLNLEDDFLFVPLTLLGKKPLFILSKISVRSLKDFP